MRPSMQLLIFGLAAEALGVASTFVHGWPGIAFGFAIGYAIAQAAIWLADHIRPKHTSYVTINATWPVDAETIADQILRAHERAKL